MNAIHVRMLAYNAEKTLRRAIDSILAQTYKNYVIYVCDNGSEDGTRAIVDEYAGKGLIKAYYNEKNGVFEGKNLEIYNLRFNIPDDDFFVHLDSDDELYPEFLEKLLYFAIENDLDIAMAGYDVFIMKTGQKGTYSLFENITENLFFETPDEWNKGFKTICDYSSAIWGKLFRGSVSKYMICDPEKGSYGGDTVQVYNALMNCSRVGIMPEKLMLYYINEGSVSYTYSPIRIKWAEYYYELSKKLLQEKAHCISDENLTYIYEKYEIFAVDSITLYIKHKIPADEIFKSIAYLFTNEAILEKYKTSDYFEVFKKGSAPDLIGFVIELIYKNSNAMNSDRLRETYHLIFDTVYQSKDLKFQTAEIDFLLGFDLRVINSILCGEFAAPAKWLQKLPESEMRNSVLEKISQLEAIK
jgi:glycosyltransferase involved in cell wall biosynthesis